MSENAAAALKRLLRDVVAPALRAEGLVGSAQTYLLPDASHWAQVGFQKSTSSTADTVNLKVTGKDWWDEQRRDHSPVKDTPPPGIDREQWDAERLKKSVYPVRPSVNTSGEGHTVRVGCLIPDVSADHWWVMTAATAEYEVAEALKAVVTYGLPWLRREVGATRP
ncbi:MAG: DUF4304 domain-containing protein [Acidimicrobiia bacterium]|nr:DUF4304 domain-containing protein [Acidimicrobiia bacterium]